jgi:hypothetical protein
MAGASVIGMAMRDDGPIHGANWIDKEVARRAVEPLRPRTDQILGPQHRPETLEQRT